MCWWRNQQVEEVLGDQAGMEQLSLSLNITHTPKAPLFPPHPPSAPPPGQGSLNKYLSLKPPGQSKLSTFQLSSNAALLEL